MNKGWWIALAVSILLAAYCIYDAIHSIEARAEAKRLQPVEKYRMVVIERCYNPVYDLLRDTLSGHVYLYSHRGGIIKLEDK